MGRLYGYVPEDLKDMNLTKKFESKLQKISCGQLTKEEFLSQLYEEEMEILKTLQHYGSEIIQQNTFDKNNAKTVAICPKCGRAMRENAKAFGCTGYRDGCDFVI